MKPLSLLLLLCIGTLIAGCSDPSAEIPEGHSVQNPLGTTPNPDRNATPAQPAPAPAAQNPAPPQDGPSASAFMEQKMRESAAEGSK